MNNIEEEMYFEHLPNINVFACSLAVVKIFKEFSYRPIPNFVFYILLNNFSRIKHKNKLYSNPMNERK